jgi:hypothetical protein
MARVRFTAVPDIPANGLTNWQAQTLAALKENVELLAGIRGEKDGASRAVTKGSLSVAAAPQQNMRRVTATGAGFTISGVTVPSLEDYGTLVTNVQELANDVAALRTTLNTLIQQLKG